MPVKKREVSILDWKDYEMEVSETIVLGKYRNQISLFDVKITYTPLGIVATSQRYKSIMELSRSEQLSDMCEQANDSIKRQFRKITGKVLVLDDEVINDKYHEIVEDDNIVKPSYFPYKDFLWCEVTQFLGRYTYKKKVEDFVTRDKVLELAAQMKLNYEAENISKECYDVFKKLLLCCDLIELGEI